jgi:polar amino acid transport system substrate-binding protein
MNNFFRAAILSFLTCCSFMTPFYHGHALAQNKTITMFIPDTDWPPYLMDDPQYPGGGVLKEVFTAIAEPMGYTVHMKKLPNKRGWLLLDKGEVDVHAKAKVWVENPDKYLWTDSFMDHEDCLLYRANSKHHYTTPKALYGKKILAIEGFVYPLFEFYFEEGKIIRMDVNDPYAMLEMLSMGRADAALVNKNETLWLFRNKPDIHPERFRIESIPHSSAEYRYVFTLDYKWIPFIHEFNQRLEVMKQDGRLKKILDQYR